MNYKRKRIRIASEFLALLFGPGPRSFHVTKNAMPEDSLVVGARFDPFDPTVVELLVESASFEEVREGGVIPEVMPELTVTSMRWTPEKPTKSGWYWFKGVAVFDGQPTNYGDAISEGTILKVIVGDDGSLLCSIMDEEYVSHETVFEGLWAGPLTPPDEEEK